MIVTENEKSIPENNPSVEFNIVHTTGIGTEVVSWLINAFGHTNEGRWFIINRSIYFKYERDYLWFRLQYP
jgi:hypothetical protein